MGACEIDVTAVPGVIGIGGYDDAIVSFGYIGSACEVGRSRSVAMAAPMVRRDRRLAGRSTRTTRRIPCDSSAGPRLSASRAHPDVVGSDAGPAEAVSHGARAALSAPTLERCRRPR